jgi:integrase
MAKEKSACLGESRPRKVVRGHAGRVSADNRARLREIDLNFHDLRHEAGSRKLEASWPLHAVSRWLGHTKLTTTDTYLNATTRLLHELNERVPLAAGEALGPKPLPALLHLLRRWQFDEGRYHAFW